MRLGTFSGAMIGAPSALVRAPERRPARNPDPIPISFTLPPVSSGEALVFTIWRMNLGRAGELITELMYGLDQPHTPAQLAPRHWFGTARAATVFTSWSSAAA